MVGDTKVAVCIPTYNRPEVIREFIEKHIRRYMQHHFDIFIYDSSEDNQTEMIVKTAMVHYPSLYYIRIESSIHSNIKVYNIFKEFGHELKFDFLWVCGDAVSWSERVLDAVCDCACRGYDVIIPNHHDVEKLGTKEYTDKSIFFLDCAWQMTYYGTTVLKVSSMLTDVDWDMLMKKYAIPECINHSHVAFYFEKINVMEEFRAIHLSFKENDIIVSPLKKASGWQNDTFYVWCHCWPSMINKLPEAYSYKDKKKVIKKNGFNSNILAYPNLKILRRDNILNKEIYCKYKKEWHNLTSVPRIRIWFLTLVPPHLVFVNKAYVKEKWLKKKIDTFCKHFNKIYIYGAGKKAIRYTKYLKEMNIRFEGYLVSDERKNLEMLNDHRVYQFSNEILQEDHTGILLALNRENAKEVLKSNLNKVNRKVIFKEFRA